MKQTYLFLLIGLLANIGVMKAAYFHRLEATNHLSQPSVMSISQDELGRMWFGTREGINVYDGREIHFYKGWVRGAEDKEVWMGNEISYVCRGKDLNMYFVSDNNLYCYDMKEDFFRQLTFGNTTQTAVEDGGVVWFIQRDSIFQWDMQAGKRTFMRKSPVPNPTVLRITKYNLFVGARQGLFVCSFRGDTDAMSFLKGVEIYSLFESKDEEMWIGTRMNGLYRMSNLKVHRVPYSAEGVYGTIDLQIREFVEDNEGNIWFGTFSGLQKYDVKKKRYERMDVPAYVGGLNHPSIFSLYKDDNGVIWLGTYYGGVNYFDPKRDGMVHYDYQNRTGKQLYYSLIGNMVKDKDGNLWLSTDGGGISCLDKEWNLLAQYTSGGYNSLLHNNVKDIAYDASRDCLFIGTYLGGLSRYDRSTRLFYHYLPYQSSPTDGNGPGAIIHHLKMWKEDLYVSSREGIFRLDIDQNRFERVVDNRYCEWFDIDEEGTMYLMGEQSFTYFSLNDIPHKKTVWLDSYGERGSVSQILARPEGLYVCTLGSGIYFFQKKDETLLHFSETNGGLPSDYCYAMQAVDSTRLLVLGDAGISLLSLAQKQIKTLELDAYSSGTSVIDGCGLYTDGQWVYVGDTKGVTFFSLDEFAYSRSYAPYFSALWVNNILISPGDESGILTQALPFIRELRLQSHQNNLTFRFQLQGDIYQHTNVLYEYKLEGFDEEWTPAPTQVIRYTKLRPGNYTLSVRLAGSQEPQQVMRIHIATPLYASWWAILLYLLILSSAICYWIWNRYQKHKLALSLESEKRKQSELALSLESEKRKQSELALSLEEEKRKQQSLEFSLERERMQARFAEEANREKMNFFTSVSHELRTPLTLIVSYVDSLLEDRLPDSLYCKLQRIKQHSQIMTRLVSDLLDFRKFSQSKVKLELSQLNICLFIHEIFTSFTYYAQHRSISYCFDAIPENILGWFDDQQLRKVFTNLLSNAFKYTPNGKEIRVKVEAGDEVVKVSVSDTGIGIAPEDIPHIFDRFYQGKHQDVTEQMAGTGIGLALTKKIVELHHGHITVESIPGAGSIFTVYLPLSKQAYQNDKRIHWSNRKEIRDTISDYSFSHMQLEEEPSDSLMPEYPYTVLLVDDNAEMRLILKNIFRKFYTVLTAPNGKEALAVAHSKMPDLVMSDVMMPEMSGTELCVQLKSDPELCHIPVILLTALNTPEQNVEGFSQGADDYITKPFDARILLARVKSLLHNRMLLQKQFEKKPVAEMDLSGISPFDQTILRKAEDIIVKHLDNPEFDIPWLCREIGIGRSTLFSKFKLLTGSTPNAFITNIRMRAAEQLFRQYPSLSIAEVSEQCGFSAVRYFSLCFKERFGTSPQTFRRELKQKSNT